MNASIKFRNITLCLHQHFTIRDRANAAISIVPLNPGSDLLDPGMFCLDLLVDLCAEACVDPIDKGI